MTPKELAEKSLVALEKAFVVGLVLNASTGSPYAHYDLSERSRAVERGETGRGTEAVEGKAGGQ
ncbi:MAG: hypothetical protein DME36_09425 [Verrucomicrobia bacterium]|nr:MAG: hypothetical protein DME36_09425 [Verrucomicrobiota bacterium]